jgi:hypothetical protein
MKTTVFGLVLAGLLALAPAIASGDADEDLRAKTQNPVGMRMGVFGNVVRPDSAPKAALKSTIQLLFPKK